MSFTLGDHAYLRDSAFVSSSRLDRFLFLLLRVWLEGSAVGKQVFLLHGVTSHIKAIKIYGLLFLFLCGVL